MAHVAEAPKGRQVGQASALTTLSPVIRGRERALHVRLTVSRLIPALARPLAGLAFIYYARWAVVGQLPGVDGQRPLNSRYLLFDTNYSGRVDAYLDGFADALPRRLERLWGTCVDFDETVMHEGELVPAYFRDYVRRNEIEVLHFYAAYPQATMLTVRQALAATRLAKAALDGDKRAEERLVPVVLGPAPEQVDWPVRVWSGIRSQVAALLPPRGARPFTIATPIVTDARDELLSLLRGLSDHASPLSALTDTHFARFALLPRRLQDFGQQPPDDVEVDYLLFTSTHVGPVEQHVAKLRALPLVDDVWGRCAGCPGSGSPQQLEAWFRAHELPTTYFAAGYQSHAPSVIEWSVARRAELERQYWETGPDGDWVRKAMKG
jgi:hypothetical protein